jgi:hypothetical protein
MCSRKQHPHPGFTVGWRVPPLESIPSFAVNKQRLPPGGFIRRQSSRLPGDATAYERQRKHKECPATLEARHV